jgi:inhibitor of KinA sporulation pathway (predicted exonuclease)
MKNEHSSILKFIQHYHSIKEPTLSGRYINADHIFEALEKAATKFELKILGQSTLGEPIHLLKIGSGKIKILMWSQMHGNESTTTKAVFDILSALDNTLKDPLIDEILNTFSLYIIPMLNPDGARAYTRVNANQVDLNRDAKNLEEVESRILRKVFDEFKPDFCFNLHDQRSIFSAGPNENPATLSFLTPSEDLGRSVTPSREESMKVIAAIYKDLSTVIPERIGRYDDGYNSNCTGDAFQSLGVPTILFEAGHSNNDYQREQTREYVFIAILSGLNAIMNTSYKDIKPEIYFNIPENEKLFYDIILRNAEVKGEIVDIAIQFKEVLKNSEVIFLGVIENISKELAFFAHKEIYCNLQSVTLLDHKAPSENVILDKILLKNEVLMIN